MIGTKYTQLTKDIKICRVINGLWQIADMERDGHVNPDLASDDMIRYVNHGFTSFDMADHYGSAEIISGYLVNKIGEGQAQLFTKWVPSPGNITKQEVRDAVLRAIKRMNVSSIDLMQFHAWSYAHPSWLDCLLELQALKKEGLIKNIGLTNFDSAHLEIAINSGIEITSNQVCYSLLDRRASSRMTDVCTKHGVKLFAFGTVAGGFLSERWLDKPEPALNEKLTWSQMKYKRYIDAAGGWDMFQKLLLTLKQVATKHGVSISNIACRYMLEQPAVAGIIVGTRLGENNHAEENDKLFSFSLNDESKNAIDATLSTMKTIPGDCGDEYRKPPYLTASGDLSHHVASFPAPYPTQVVAEDRTKALSGTIWEDLAGFSRATRKGNTIFVSGTTATHKNMVVGGNDARSQTHFVIDKIEGAIQSLGGKLEDVIRTRIFIKNLNDWEVISRAHGERFSNIQPANTMVRADLIGDEYLVEIEAEAIVT